MTSYAELVCASTFSFLRGASTPAELIEGALRMNYSGLGLCDRNSVAGVVRALSALEDFARAEDEMSARAKKFKFVAWARLAFVDGAPDIAAFPRQSGGLGAIVSSAHPWQAARQKRRMLASSRPSSRRRRRSSADRRCRRRLSAVWSKRSLVCVRNPCRVWLGANMPRGGADRRRLLRLRQLAREQGVKLLAQNDALYACPDDRALQDVLTCVRERIASRKRGGGSKATPNAI